MQSFEFVFCVIVMNERDVIHIELSQAPQNGPDIVKTIDPL